jgi:hypothetical protein
MQIHGVAVLALLSLMVNDHTMECCSHASKFRDADDERASSLGPTLYAHSLSRMPAFDAMKGSGNAMSPQSAAQFELTFFRHLKSSPAKTTPNVSQASQFELAGSAV